MNFPPSITDLRRAYSAVFGVTLKGNNDDRHHSYLQPVLLLIYHLSAFPIFSTRSIRCITPLQASEKSYLMKQRKLSMWQFCCGIHAQTAELMVTPFKRLYCSPLPLLSLSLVLNGRDGEYVAAIDLSGISGNFLSIQNTTRFTVYHATTMSTV